MRFLFILLSSALLLAACGPGSEDLSQGPTAVVLEAAPTRTPIDSVPLPATATPAAPGCIPQTTWPVYTVARGDTLTSIANRTGSTVDVLVAANCLQNPNALNIGQPLHVPTLPRDEEEVPSGPFLTHISALGGGLMFEYPAGWNVSEQGDGEVLLISAASFASVGGTVPPPAGWTADMAMVNIMILPPDDVTFEQWVPNVRQSLLTHIVSRPEDLSEAPLVLPGGYSGVRFTFVTPSGHSIQHDLLIINGYKVLVETQGNFDEAFPVINSLRSS